MIKIARSEAGLMRAKESKARYDAEHTQQIRLKLNTGTDADILEELNRQPNKQGYIKQLIREDIAKRQK